MYPGEEVHRRLAQDKLEEIFFIPSRAAERAAMARDDFTVSGAPGSANGVAPAKTAPPQQETRNEFRKAEQLMKEINAQQRPEEQARWARPIKIVDALQTWRVYQHGFTRVDGSGKLVAHGGLHSDDDVNARKDIIGNIQLRGKDSTEHGAQAQRESRELPFAYLPSLRIVDKIPIEPANPYTETPVVGSSFTCQRAAGCQGHTIDGFDQAKHITVAVPILDVTKAQEAEAAEAAAAAETLRQQQQQQQQRQQQQSRHTSRDHHNRHSTRDPDHTHATELTPAHPHSQGPDTARPPVAANGATGNSATNNAPVDDMLDMLQSPDMWKRLESALAGFSDVDGDQPAQSTQKQPGPANPPPQNSSSRRPGDDLTRDQAHYPPPQRELPNNAGGSNTNPGYIPHDAHWPPHHQGGPAWNGGPIGLPPQRGRDFHPDGFDRDRHANDGPGGGYAGPDRGRFPPQGVGGGRPYEDTHRRDYNDGPPQGGYGGPHRGGYEGGARMGGGPGDHRRYEGRDAHGPTHQQRGHGPPLGGARHSVDHTSDADSIAKAMEEAAALLLPSNGGGGGGGGSRGSSRRDRDRDRDRDRPDRDRERERERERERDRGMDRGMGRGRDSRDRGHDRGSRHSSDRRFR